MKRAVCVTCSVEMEPDRNGHIVELMAGKEPYQLWEGDRYKCQHCGIKVVVGFGAAPLVEHYHDSYGRTLEKAMASGDFTRVED